MGPDSFDIVRSPQPAAERPASYSVLAPAEQTIPVVFASPHSGDDYPPEFVAQARIDALMLRRSEDAFIDQIFAAAPHYGAPLLKAHFPRVYVDPNREPYELDPAMFDGPLPAFANRASPRVAAGLGTIARVVASGENIYPGKLDVTEVIERIERHYFPYHRALQALLEGTLERFGCYLLIDCHSMPSIGGPMDSDPGLKRVDFVLGDCHAMSCSGKVTDAVERAFTELGYSIRRNNPYAGGYTTRHYGRPREGRHALQIEVNRALYMDEIRIRPTDGLARLTNHVNRLFTALAGLSRNLLARR